MKIQTKKRGFTLVELLVVIAILAILATVSVIGYTSYIKKANVSNDTALVSQLNTVLQGAEMTDGKNATMTDALADAWENGLGVAKLTPASSGDIVWDSTNDRFVLVDENGDVVYAESGFSMPSDKKQLWKIAETLDEVQASDAAYSYYLTADVVGSATQISVSTGIDAGESTLDIAYTSTTVETVLFRTNGGTLTVNNANATVQHYGDVDKVVVTAVASNSYHEFGAVEGTIEVAQGRVVVESGASASAVVITATSLDNVKLEAQSGADVASVAATDSTVAGSLATSSSISGVSSDKVITTAIDETALQSFAGGIGTEASPYLIGSIEQWKNFATNSAYSEAGYYWKVTTDLDFTNVTGTVASYNFKGYIDFAGHTVQGLSLANCAKNYASCYGGLFYIVYGDSKISNLNYHLSDLGQDYSVRVCMYAFGEPNVSSENSGQITFEAVNTYGEVSYSDNNVSTCVYYIKPGSADLEYYVNFTNCTNYCQISNVQSHTGVFVGAILSNTKGTANLCFENCVNKGNIYAIGDNVNAIVSVLLSNPDTNGSCVITAENCSNSGYIFVSSKSTGNYNLIPVNNNVTLATGTTNSALTKVAVFGGKYSISDGKISFTAADSESSYSIVYTYVSTNSLGGTLNITFDNLTLDQVKAFVVYDFVLSGDAFTATSSTTYGATGFNAATLCDGKVLISTITGDLPYAQPTMTILSYDSEGNLVNAYNLGE